MSLAWNCEAQTRWTPAMRDHRGRTSEWQHTSGWHIFHCGHPTAIRPYYLVRPGRRPTQKIVVSHNGLAFTTLRAAKLAHAGLLAGRCELVPFNGVLTIREVQQ